MVNNLEEELDANDVVKNAQNGRWREKSDIFF
jgi:hypothetical protein